MLNESPTLSRILAATDGALIVTIAQTAKLIGFTDNGLRNARAAGRFPLAFVKIGRSVGVRATDLAALIDGIYQAPPTTDAPRRGPGRPRKLAVKGGV